MTARLYADENFDQPVVEELRLLGHDVLTVQEAGKGGQGIDDPEVLAFAISEQRAVLTFDRRDFKRLHRRFRPHYGIVICSRDDDFSAQAKRVHQALQGYSNLENQLILVNRPATP